MGAAQRFAERAPEQRERVLSKHRPAHCRFGSTRAREKGLPFGGGAGREQTVQHGVKVGGTPPPSAVTLAPLGHHSEVATPQ